MSQYISQAIRPLCNPTIWQKVIALVNQTKGINLSQGAPQFGPQSFFIQNLKKAALQKCEQQPDIKGLQQLRKSIVKFHQRQYNNLDCNKNILVTCGASAALYFTFMNFLNHQQNDQVLLFQPAFDFYRHYASLCKVKTKNVKLYPSETKTRKEVKQMIINKQLNKSKDWLIDWKSLQQKLTEKIKIIVINSPHNPTGKVFTQDQIDMICQLVIKFPNLIIIEDCVYEGFIFDEFKEKYLPKTIHSKYYNLLKNRIIHIYSGGKLLQATGIRVGWIICQQQKIINEICKLHSSALQNVPFMIQKTIHYCLQDIIKQKFYYLKIQASRLQYHRQQLLNVLSSCKYNFKITIPKSGYFILIDIQNVNVKEKYFKFRTEEGSLQNRKDLAFCYQMALEDGVIIVPCSSFFFNQNKQEKYISFAFCKNISSFKDAQLRICQNLNQK